MNRELLKKNFESHGYKVLFFETKEEAAAYLEGRIHGTTVGIGGSMTALAMNLHEILAKDNEVWEHNYNKVAHRDKESTSPVYIASANGVSETGEMVNIDGSGNRLAATLFGPKQVYFIIGRNKIVPTLADAIDRAKNVASPLNAKRLNRKTPCVVTGKCENCNSPERICRGMAIYERALTGQSAELLFIDEDLGF